MSFNTMLCFIHKYEGHGGFVNSLKQILLDVFYLPASVMAPKKGRNRRNSALAAGIGMHFIQSAAGEGRLPRRLMRRFGFLSSMSWAMRIKLLASTAAPTSISNLSRPLEIGRASCRERV